MTDTHSGLPAAELRRVARQTLLPEIGLKGQNRLHEAHVLVIGAGGLGCPLMQQLAAAGIGAISVIDDDRVALSNIHRQILFGAEDVGRPKAERAVEHIQRLQPGLVATGIQDRFNPSNALQLLDGTHPEIPRPVDLLIDGSDNFATKFLAADAAEVSGVPLVWGTVLRFHGDVAVWWSGAGRRGVGMRDLYPAEPDAGSVPDCATAGVLGVTTSVIAGLMATEAIVLLAGIAPDLEIAPEVDAGYRCVGRLLSYDALAARLTQFRVGPDPARSPITELSSPVSAGCSVPAAERHEHSDRSDTADATGSAELLERLAAGRAIAIDVRELGEKVLRDLPSAERHPGYHLPTSLWSRDLALGEQLLLSLSEPTAGTDTGKHTGATDAPRTVGTGAVGAHAAETNVPGAEAAGTDPAGALDESAATPVDVLVYCASGKRSQAFVECYRELATSNGLRLHDLAGGTNHHGLDCENGLGAQGR